MILEKAILAGGCFWGMEELFRTLLGVINTRVGYCGGSLKNPTYNEVKTGKTGHAETLEITYDPQLISYFKLLEFFFQIHDPTTKERQGNDIGPQYRSAIFYLNEQQKHVAEEIITAVKASEKWPREIVTEVTQVTSFYEAESYHQDYLQRYPDGYTCHWVRPGWKLD